MIVIRGPEHSNHPFKQSRPESTNRPVIEVKLAQAHLITDIKGLMLIILRVKPRCFGSIGMNGTGSGRCNDLLKFVGHTR